MTYLLGDVARYSPSVPFPVEAVVVVRDAESRAVLDVLNQLVTGMDLAFSLVQIPDSDDWGTADSLRHLRGKLKVLVTMCVVSPLASPFPSAPA